MSYPADLSVFFMVRTSKSHFYQSGSGQRMPKLYRLGDAKRFISGAAKWPNNEYDGPWEIVPVTLVFGEPLKLD